MTGKHALPANWSDRGPGKARAEHRGPKMPRNLRRVLEHVEQHMGGVCDLTPANSEAINLAMGWRSPRVPQRIMERLCDRGHMVAGVNNLGRVQFRVKP